MKMDIEQKLMIRDNIENLTKMEIKLNYLSEHIVLKINKGFTKKMERSMIKEGMK